MRLAELILRIRLEKSLIKAFHERLFKEELLESH